MKCEWYERPVWYFHKPGSVNTDKTINLAKNRAFELSINHVVVASRSGKTGLKTAKTFSDTDVKVIVVSHQYGWKPFRQSNRKYLKDMDRNSDERMQLEKMGVPLIFSTMPLSSPGRLFRIASGIKTSRRYLTTFPTDIIADTLRMFSQGMKVCVEITIMAADVGEISDEEEIIAIAGTGDGADTAIVIKPAHMTNLFDLEIREIIAMPRLS